MNNEPSAISKIYGLPMNPGMFQMHKLIQYQT